MSTKLEKYGLEVKGYGKFIDIMSELNSDSRILILDDIDYDGVVSAYICKTALSERFRNIEVLINNEHGLSNYKKDVTEMKYDLVILVDSSSDLSDTFGDMGRVVIIDHHLYDSKKKITDNVLLLNSKDNKDLESISAGMFCYLLMEQYAKDTDLDFDKKLFSLGATSLYGDIVPVDDTVKSFIDDFIIDIENDNIHELLNHLNDFKKALTRSVISYNIVPKINYTRKMQDERTISMIYRDCMSLANPLLIKNSRVIKSNVDYIYSRAEVRKFNNFIYSDITRENEEISDDMENFKGLICNKLMKKYDMPSLVSTTTPNGTIKISVRSEGYDTYSFIKENKLKGGGHAFACGFKCEKTELEYILNKYDEYLNGKEYKPEINTINTDIERLKLENLEKDALDNEYSFSNLKVKQYSLKVKTTQIKSIDTKNKKFNIDGISFTCFYIEELLRYIEQEEYINILITPTVESHALSIHVLVSEVNKIE